MIRDYDILIDVTTGRLIRDVNSDVQIQPRPFVQGDTYNVRVKACQPRPGRPIGRVYDYVELPEAIYVALGDVGQRPESGQFTLTYDGDTTAPLVYNASPAQVQAALALLDSIVAAGGVTVAGEAGGPYQVTFAQAGVREAFQATTAGLYPPTGSTVYDARTGTAEIASVQIIALDRQSAALAVTFTDLPEPTGSVTEIQAGSDTTREIQRVTISSDTYDGTFALAFDGASTGALPYNIEALDLQAALEAVETWGEGVTVTGAFPTWDITFGGDPANQELATIDITGLKVPIGKQGELALTTAGIEAIVAGQAVANTKLEVAVVEDAKHATLLQVDAAVLNDGIQNAPETGPTLPEYYTKPEVDALVTIATQAEAEAGTVNNKLMTPLRTAQAIAFIGSGGSPSLLYDYRVYVNADKGDDLTAIFGRIDYPFETMDAAWDAWKDQPEFDPDILLQIVLAPGAYTLTQELEKLKLRVTGAGLELTSCEIDCEAPAGDAGTSGSPDGEPGKNIDVYIESDHSVLFSRIEMTGGAGGAPFNNMTNDSGDGGKPKLIARNLTADDVVLAVGSKGVAQVDPSPNACYSDLLNCVVESFSANGPAGTQEWTEAGNEIQLRLSKIKTLTITGDFPTPSSVGFARLCDIETGVPASIFDYVACAGPDV